MINTSRCPSGSGATLVGVAVCPPSLQWGHQLAAAPSESSQKDFTEKVPGMELA